MTNALRKLQVLNSFLIRPGYSLGGFVGTEFISLRKVISQEGSTLKAVHNLKEGETEESIETFELDPVMKEEWEVLLLNLPSE